MNINIDRSKLTDSPYSADRKEAFLFEESDVIEQITQEVKHGNPSSFLVSGYRGAGKTSFVNRILEKLSPEFVCVSINLAKYDGYPHLVKKLIRHLYHAYDVNIKENNIDGGALNVEFKLLYDRTFHEVTHSQMSGFKREEKVSLTGKLDLKKILPFLLLLLSALNLQFNAFFTQIAGYVFLLISVIWACITTFELGFSGSQGKAESSELTRKSLYDDEIAEYHLLTILRKLQQQGIKVVIAFDELDKIRDLAVIEKIIDELKSLLLSGYANFFVIAGQLLHYEYERSALKDDQVISTLFSKCVHVPFLKYAHLKQFCLNLIEDANDKTRIQVNDLFDSLILTSGHIPRKLVNLIRARLRWDNGRAYISIEDFELRQVSKAAELLHALIYIIDNNLLFIAENDMQSDFFTAQIHLWIAKIKAYNGWFVMSTIVETDSYKGHYPESYVEWLMPLGRILVERLTKEGMLEMECTDDPKTEDKYRWHYDWGDVESTDPGAKGTLTLSNNKLKKGKAYLYSTFINGSKELEVYIRKFYFELIPVARGNRSAYSFSLKELVNRMVDLGVLPDPWYDSSAISEMIEVRNRIAIGEPVNENDIYLIHASAFTINRLKIEMASYFTYYVSKRYLKNYNVSRVNIYGYDFVAVADNNFISFDVKYLGSERTELINIGQLMEKYSKLIEVNKSDCSYVLFFYSSVDAASEIYDEFYDATFDYFPDLRGRFHLFYLSDTSYISMSETIEESLEEMLARMEVLYANGTNKIDTTLLQEPGETENEKTL